MTTRENAYQRTMDKEYVLNNEWQTKSGVYLAKFTNEGKYNWGTYFATGTYRRPDPKEARMSISLTEVLTGIDVYKDEIAFSWDLEQYFVRHNDTLPLPEFLIVTDDAEQKKGVKNAGWQTQVFKIDTAGTTLKYGTFYAGDDGWSKNIKYDNEGNLILHVATNRKIPKKDSVFKSTGYLTFVKYNRKNELEWDFGTLCSNAGGTNYDFDIDENNVLWTAGRTSCKNMKKGINPLPTDRDTSGGPTRLIFILDLNNYKHWFSYYDSGGYYNNDVSVRNNILNASGRTETLRTKIDNKLGTFYNQTTIGFFISIDLNDIIEYMNPTDSVDPNDTLSPNQNIIYYPNPVNDYLYLKNVEKIKSIKIIDLVGKEYINLKDTQSKEINVSQLSVGIYFLIINEEKIIKFIKR